MSEKRHYIKIILCFVFFSTFCLKNYKYLQNPSLVALSNYVYILHAPALENAVMITSIPNATQDDFAMALPSVPHVTVSSMGDAMISFKSPRKGNSSRLLIYVTTVFSEVHCAYLSCCWPRLLKESRLFQNAHVMLFSNNVTILDESFLTEVKALFTSFHVASFEFKFADGTPELYKYKDYIRKRDSTGSKQFGANMAMSIGATLGWFKPFDWVVRINPDVLIRNSSFLMDCVNDPAVDAVIIWCSPLRIHTDFFAFRPKALGPDAFVNMTNEHATIPRINHEATVTTSFMEIIKSSRYRMVPDLKPSQGHCRVRGEKAPVYHMHDSCSQSPVGRVCNALEGWDVQ